MNWGDWLYIGQSINPIAGLLASVPWAILHLQYPLWLVLMSAPLLAYTQVVVVDLLFDQLVKRESVRRFIERKRSPRMERLLASGGAFVPVVLATPLVGGWVIMLVMRYAKVPQRRVAAPILLSLFLVTAVIGILCATVPALFS